MALPDDDLGPRWLRDTVHIAADIRAMELHPSAAPSPSLATANPQAAPPPAGPAQPDRLPYLLAAVAVLALAALVGVIVMRGRRSRAH